MCFYCAQSKKALELAKRYGRKSNIIEMAQEVLNEQYKINAFAHPVCAIVTENESIVTAQWGLIPAWIKTSTDAAKMSKMCLNARSETVFEKPVFKGIHSKRCLLPVTGYFEFQHTTNGVLPYYIFLRDEDIFSLGGIIETWQKPETKETIQTFTILTTAANSLCAKIHNGGKNPHRMPVIVGKENEEIWLDKSLNENDIKLFFRSYDDGKMDAYQVVRDFMKRNDKTVIERLTKSDVSLEFL